MVPAVIIPQPTTTPITPSPSSGLRITITPRTPSKSPRISAIHQFEPIISPNTKSGDSLLKKYYYSSEVEQTQDEEKSEAVLDEALAVIDESGKGSKKKKKRWVKTKDGTKLMVY